MIATHILTGEYPPAPGGVSDYTRLLARALVAAGEDVHVWAPTTPAGPFASDPGVTVHPLPGVFDLPSLATLTRELDATPAERRLLIQYVPHAFGMRAMNVAFPLWLASRRRDDVWLMLHEVAYPFERGQKLRHTLLAAITRLTAMALVARADRTFVSTLSWVDYLRSFAPWASAPTCLPIPSNLPTEVSEERRKATRASLKLAPSEVLVGHFGTYGSHLTEMLADVFKQPFPAQVRWLLLGRGGPSFARKHLADRPNVVAPGELSEDDAAAHLAACDVVFQPYADGISTRRTSAMASLALGRPMVTNAGWLTEPIWRSGGVALASSPATADLAAELRELLADPSRARALGEAGRALYEAHFSMARTIQTLTGRDVGGRAEAP